MKNFCKLVGIIAVVTIIGFSMIACDDGSGNDGDNGTGDNGNGNNGNGQNGNGNGNGGIVRSVKLYDANDTFLGYCSFGRDDEITVISSKNYLYQIYWTGELFYYCRMYFTGENGTGNAYLANDPKTIGYGKSIICWNDTLYTYVELNTNGVPKYEDSVPDFLSSGYNGRIYDSYSPPGGDEKLYRLKTITKTEAGIPEAIILPLKFTFE
jgi:hypothetical protein